MTLQDHPLFLPEPGEPLNIAWHFLKRCNDEYDALRDGTWAPSDRTELVVDTAFQPMLLCRWGLHWSRRPLDALMWAPNHRHLTLCCVHVAGEIHEENRHSRMHPKGVSTRRTILWRLPATPILRTWSRFCLQQWGPKCSFRNYSAASVARKIVYHWREYPGIYTAMTERMASIISAARLKQLSNPPTPT